MKRSIDLVYSYGGTRESPLVKGVVPFTYDPEIHTTLQEALLERTELFLGNLKDTFDQALRVFEDATDRSKEDRLRALDIMISTVTYTTNTILVASPSVHYAIMFERIQSIFRHMDTIKDAFGDQVATNVQTILKPVWVNLRALDSSFNTNDDEKED